MQTEVIRKKNTAFARGLIVVFSVIMFVVVSIAVYKIVDILQKRPSMAKVYGYWQNGEYRKVYDETATILASKPFDPTAEAYHGYAAFYLGVGAADFTETERYLDEAIISLRLARENAAEVLLPQVDYLLGKAYFHKNNAASYHYYADLVVRFISEAVSLGYEAADIPEYLGLSYAQLGMTNESIAAFTEALMSNDSDVLLLAIAEQYLALENVTAARQYLYRLLGKTADDTKAIEAACMMAEIFINEGDYPSALKMYNDVLEKNADYADAYYGIGVIYELQGNMAKARAEWRKALKVRANHAGALQKLGLA